MIQEERSYLEQQLQDVPYGGVTVDRHSPAGQKYVLLTDQFSAQTAGKGKLEVYQPLSGVDVSYNMVIGPEITVHHAASDTILELFYCHSGRVGWKMRGDTSVYLGAGDLTIHSACCCADSLMMFPLGYTEGISISLDMTMLETNCPEILREAGMDFQALKTILGTGKPIAIPACRELEGIFAPIYSASSIQRKAYLYLKVQELLLYLSNIQTQTYTLEQYESQQTEVVKEIHRQLTTHLNQRFTIEELARKYLINTSTLKDVFKAVYGQPIGAYMKGYRVESAMELLRKTDIPISEIAERVGYKTQGKFSNAFKDVTHMLPTEYRNIYRAGSHTGPRASDLFQP